MKTLKTYYDKLPRKRRLQFKRLLEIKTEKSCFVVDNWVKGNSKVPQYYLANVCRAAELVVRQHIRELTGLDYQFHINFKMEDKIKAKTTIRAERALKGNITMAELAEAVGVAQATISKYEREAVLPTGLSISLPNARKIAAFFGKEISDFREFCQ